MPPRGTDDRRRALLARAIVVAAAALALASTAKGLRVELPRLEETREYWAALDPAVRDDPVAQMYGFGEELWRRLDTEVRDDERYAVLAQGDGQHEIRNYAGYRLMPAIQVRDPADADVVVYYQVRAPESGCERLGRDVCIVRRAR